jgi:hypothetical protein
LTIIAVVVANLTYGSAILSVAVFFALTLGYVAVYARMVRYHWCSPLQFLLVKPPRAAGVSY